MRELIRLLVPFVMESDRLSQPLDVRFITGQEMPAILSASAVVCFHVCLLFLSGKLWRLARVETDCDDFVLLADVEVDLPKRTEHAIQNLIAEHRARVINQRQHYGTAFEEIAEPHIASLLIFENGIERRLLIQSLFDADRFQNSRQASRNRTRFRSRAVERRAGHRDTGLRGSSEQ